MKTTTVRSTREEILESARSWIATRQSTPTHLNRLWSEETVVKILRRLRLRREIKAADETHRRNARELAREDLVTIDRFLSQLAPQPPSLPRQ